MDGLLYNNNNNNNNNNNLMLLLSFYEKTVIGIQVIHNKYMSPSGGSYILCGFLIICSQAHRNFLHFSLIITQALCESSWLLQFTSNNGV